MHISITFVGVHFLFLWVPLIKEQVAHPPVCVVLDGFLYPSINHLRNIIAEKNSATQSGFQRLSIISDQMKMV
jgi:hypothetical protein